MSRFNHHFSLLSHFEILSRQQLELGPCAWLDTSVELRSLSTPILGEHAHSHFKCLG